ncbi:MAG: TonB-dependent receptor [Proteobacteria bacterium]|nr:TonB-dependent receptor [Pseudomonadota bacterium]
MQHRSRIRLLSAMMAGAAFAAFGATAAFADDVETVVVTGSRIPTTNASSPSPLSVATAEQIQMTSAFALEDVLRKMTGPDSTAGLTNNSNNGGVGLSEIGLRNLGPTRTLVLVDGQRLVPIFSGASSVPDLNSVPISMVDRVEVLRDGASSIYGADAIGGVVNVITKKDFDGLNLDFHGGASEHGGGDNYGGTATLGFNVNDRGNVTIAILNEHESPVDAKDREWAQNPYIGTPFEGGSAYRSQLNILQDEGSATVWNGGVETDYHDPSLASVPCLTYLPGLGRVKLNAGCPDVTPNKTLTSSLGRTQVSLNGHYDITPDVTFVTQAFFTRRDSEQRLRPEPLLGDAIASTNPLTGVPVFGGFQVPTTWPGFNDPLLTASIVPCAGNAIAGGTAQCINAFYTPNEFGPRDYKQTSDTYRVRFGFEGHVFTDYNWEAGYVMQRNDTVQRTANSGNWQHLAQATGQLPCIDVPGGCTFNPLFGYATPTTPFNFFNGANTLTPDQVKYLTFTMTDNNNSYENYIYADVNGPVWDLPAGPLMASVGFERRFEHLTDNPDTLVQEGYAANPSAATSGGYNVTSVYGELRIPVFKHQPFAESLTITPSARFDHYSSFGDAKTWKVGADWQVDDNIRFRGTYATGFRAPSVAELFGGNGVSYISVSGDPCDSRAAGFNGNANAGTASLAAGSTCYAALSALGLSPVQIANYQSPENNLSNDQRGLIIGGNPLLKPEQSHSWNVGTVITPEFLPGFSFDADYYEITIDNSILTGGIAQNSGPDLVVNGCYVQQIAGYCALISRNVNGIFQIGSQNTNFGRSHVAGMDLQATYNTAEADLDLPIPGSMLFNVEVSRQFTNTTQNPDGTYNHFSGTFLYSNESIQPNWKSTLSVDWNDGPWSLHWDTQFISGTGDYPGPSAANGRPKTVYAWGDEIPDYFYHNVSVAYDMDGFFGDSTGVKHTRLILGINNLFDKDPPILAGDSICKCNSFAGPYDFVGRFFFTRLSVGL